MPAALDRTRNLFGVARHVAYDPSGCLVWTGSRVAKGYGVVRVPRSRRMQAAHRYIYERMVGPIPDGMQLDHLCRNRACVRWDHLEPVTNRENTLRGETIPARWAARTQCEDCGGPFEIARGRRVCKPCRTRKAVEWNRDHRELVNARARANRKKKREQ